jgi:hypothetical protein
MRPDWHSTVSSIPRVALPIFPATAAPVYCRVTPAYCGTTKHCCASTAYDFRRPLAPEPLSAQLPGPCLECGFKVGSERSRGSGCLLPVPTRTPSRAPPERVISDQFAERQPY